ncbi:MAG: hypothetical protein C4576_35420 [Desulfobacteraceae bacterium]|nr:MAG: hypothetical protein C4576_35420 [Desulfobacteraceae bacterium]
MMDYGDKTILPALLKRCEVRLENDARALEQASSERMKVAVGRFGGRVIGLELLFPALRTAFMNHATRTVETRQAEVVARIRPNAGNGFPYPLGSPEVRVEFPKRSDRQLVPWLSGLAWLDVFGGNEVFFGDSPFGIPCLWRNGEWSPERDLLFVAGQVHRLLTDPGNYSPADSMNPEAALYWVSHKDELPLEQPIPELSGGRNRSSQAITSVFSRFALTVAE